MKTLEELNALHAAAKVQSPTRYREEERAAMALYVAWPEWSAWIRDAVEVLNALANEKAYCRWCAFDSGEGHADDCKLTALLARLEAKP